MKKQLEILALQNAIKFNGKANPGAVIGGILGQNPELKAKIKEISKEIQEVVKEVNSLSLEEQKRNLAKLGVVEEKKEKKRRELPELANTENGVVTRIPPEPSKYPHIGHALSFLINYIYAKKYNGKCVLRLDDTNPGKAKKEYYDAVYEGLLWLKINVDRTIIASKEMETFYKYAVELIEKERAYVCFCDKETISEQRTKAMICKHRTKNVRQNLELWKEMLDGKYKPGEAVLRLTGEIDSTNAVMRDPILFRLIDGEHPIVKSKYKVWPMYDFETVVGEEISGVTHILRSNEFGHMRIELQNYIKDLLGFRKQEVKQYGRFNIVGAVTQGRVIREMIEKGEVDGWDDPRLVTIKSLKRRGIVPEALYELAVESGLSSTQTNIDWTVLAAINRKLIDPVVKRYFFVDDPKKVSIDHDLKVVEVPLHPEKDMGVKKMKLSKEFYVSDDIKDGIVYRFMHVFNFKNKNFISEEYDPELKAKIVHAVPVEGAIDVEVLMADGSVIKGKGEKALSTLKEGDIVQFERRFFCRLDDKEGDTFKFVYTHD